MKRPPGAFVTVDNLPCLQRPEVNKPVMSGRGHIAAILRTADCDHVISVALQRSETFARLGVPDADGAVERSGGDAVAVAEPAEVDHVAEVAVQGLERRVVLDRPQFDG